MAYLHELSSQINALRGKDKVERLNYVFGVAPKPSVTACFMTDRRFGQEYLANPKKKIDPLMVKLLTENHQDQYNLVCNVMLDVVECNDTDKLNGMKLSICWRNEVTFEKGLYATL